MRLTRFLWLVTLLLLSGCIDEFLDTPPKPTAGPLFTLVPVGVKKPRIYVVDFVDQTGVDAQFQQTGGTLQVGTPGAPLGAPGGKLTIRNPIGYGMKAQLRSELSRMGCFRLFDTPEPPDGLGIDYEVSGSVTEYQPSEKSIGGAVGYTPQSSAIIPGLVGSDPTVSAGSLLVSIMRERAGGAMAEWDHVAIDVTLTNASTREYWSMGIEGKGTSAGIAMAAEFGRWTVDWGAQRQANIQKVIRACMDGAARWVASQTLSADATPFVRDATMPVPPKERPLPPRETTAGPGMVAAKAQTAVVRERPDPNTREIGRFRKGTEFQAGEVSGEWTRVRLGSLEGWMLTQDLEPLPAPEADMVVVRERPEPDSPVLCEVRKDTKFDSAEPSGDWIKVKLGTLEGWVVAADLSVTATAEEGPPSQKPTEE